MARDLDVQAVNVAAFINTYLKTLPNAGIREIVVRETGPAGLTIDMLINPQPFESLSNARLEVRLTGDGASALTRLP